jgi:hypothetical protein
MAAPVTSIGRLLQPTPAASGQWRSTKSRKWQLTAEGAVGSANTDCSQLSSVSRAYVQVARNYTNGGVAFSVGANSFSSLDPAVDRQGMTGSVWRVIGRATLQVELRTHLTGLVRSVQVTPRNLTYVDSAPSDSGWVETPRQRTVIDTTEHEENRRALDLRTRLRWSVGRLAFDLVAGSTAGSNRGIVDTASRGTDGNRADVLVLRPWGRADVRFAATSFMDITAGLAVLPEQPVLGAPARRVAMVGMSLGALPRLLSRPAGKAAPAIEFDRQDSGSVVLRVRIPNATLVELSGEPTSWQPIAMRRSRDDWWEAELRIPPGSYRMNVRVDGKRWSAPPGTVATRDEFGGEVGVVLIK